MEELELIFPNEEYKFQIMEYLQEHYNNNEFEVPGYRELNDIANFDIWLQRVKNDVILRQDINIPETMYLVIRKFDNKIIGNVKIRSKLNDSLKIRGGHIGYGVRPSERKKGYAKQILKLALQVCNQIGLNEVLLTCDKNNIASAKTILANGGRLKDEIILTNNNIDKIIQRYIINI